MAKKSFNDRAKAVYNFLVSGIWQTAEADVSMITRFFLRLLKKIILSVRGYLDHRLAAKAGALTYNTLMAIVPIFALIIAIGKGFGFQTAIENWATKIFGTQKELVPYIIQFVNNYLEQAQGGVFLGIGVAVLLWSVMSVFRQVESNFNAIWNVQKSRSVIRQFTTYFSLMLVAPILIVLSSGVSIFFQNQLKQLGFSEHFSWLYEFSMRLTPYIIYWILFTFVFIVIPNTKVQFKHALFAGIVVGTAFQIFQWLYVNGQINLTKYNAVYGSFAAIPLLLFWLQISWQFVLYGAELTYAGQNIENYNFEKETARISRRYRDYVTIIIMRCIVLRFAKGEQPFTTTELAHHTHTPIRLVNQILNLLVEIKMVAETYTPNDNGKAYQPAIDINVISVQMLLEKIEKHGSENFKIAEYSEEYEKIWEKLQTYNQNSSEIGNVLIKDL